MILGAQGLDTSVALFLLQSGQMPEEKASSPFRFSRYFGIGFSLLVLILFVVGFFDGLENRWQDTLFRLRGMQFSDPRILLVTLDDITIEKIGRWPIPRHYYADLLEKLSKLGVRAVGLDILFLEPSIPEEDQAIARATRQFKNLVNAVDNNPQVSSHFEFRFPLKAIQKNNPPLGVVNAYPDSDNVVRFSLLFWDGWNKAANSPMRLPALGLQTLAIYEGKPLEYYEKNFPKQVRLNIRGQRTFWVTNPKTGQLEEHFEYGFKRLSFINILEGRLNPQEKNQLKDSMVLVGSIARGAYDHYPSPFFEQTPGVEIHANLIDNLLDKRYLRESSALWTLALICGMAFLGIWFIQFSPLVGALSTLGVLLAWAGVDYWLFLKNIRVDFVSPAGTLFITYVVLLVQKALLENREKRQIKNMFGQYVAPEVVDILVRDPSKLKLGGDKREMTAFFLDIAHFTNISEKMDPTALIEFLNEYLSALTDVVQKNKGVVDKCIGDCIMAFWNAPLDEPNHRQLACLSAVECIQALQDLNRRTNHLPLSEKPSIRIGLNSGYMTVGNTGSLRKKAYTVIGDEVNLASRLEGANKFFESKILASEATYASSRDLVEAREIGRIRVVGKAIPIRVYELLAKKGELSDKENKMLHAYREGFDLFKLRKFKEAVRSFKAALSVDSEDGPSKLYLRISEDYVAAPPPSNWDGVFNLTAK
ncbi:MAG: adenylate/guanylate cyclase domain-containing protein [Elusimicrobia bacterium]|nr:adenylate/guanylate cyclase domain-containing protein [Elusimicrobiota bacterium]